MAPKIAGRGTIKTLTRYEPSFQPNLDHERIMTLAQLGFIERLQTVHFLRSPEIGKSHLFIALDVFLARTCTSAY
jgi:hypothetical protein